MFEWVVGEWIYIYEVMSTVRSCTAFYDALSMDVSETLFDMHNYKTEATEMNCGNPRGELTYEK